MIDPDSLAYKWAEESLIGELKQEGIDFSECLLRSDAVEFILRQLQSQFGKKALTATQLSETKTLTYLGFPAQELVDSIVTRSRIAAGYSTSLQVLQPKPSVVQEMLATELLLTSLQSELQKVTGIPNSVLEQIRRGSK